MAQVVDPYMPQACLHQAPLKASVLETPIGYQAPISIHKNRVGHLPPIFHYDLLLRSFNRALGMAVSC